MIEEKTLTKRAGKPYVRPCRNEHLLLSHEMGPNEFLNFTVEKRDRAAETEFEITICPSLNPHLMINGQLNLRRSLNMTYPR